VDNKEIFRRYVEALCKPDSLNEVLSPDFIAHDLNPPANRDGLIAFRRVVMGSFPEQKATILDIMAEGDRVAARMIAEQTHDRTFMGIPPTGQKVIFEIYEIVRIANGTVAERWVAMKPSLSEILQQLRAHSSK
jgi:predicted ester cyclase